MELVLFYNLPSCSESHFMNTIAPSLKNSLSLTLKHFIPLAGNIIFPLTTGMPVSHYVNGDSVPLAIAVSDADLNHLTANHPRDADQFHDFFAPLPPATYSPDFIKFSTAAFQVTLFPNQGICIGVTQHHAIADGSTCIRFLHTWASINKFNGDDAHLLAPGQSCLSFYDRSGGVQGGDSLRQACWDRVKMLPPTVRSANIRKLVNSFPGVSPFAIICALVWTSLARSDADVDDDEVEYFNCVADGRARSDPPLPGTYFGYCLAFVVAELTHGTLKGDPGIVVAAEAIGEAIKKTVNNEKGILDGTMKRLLELERIKVTGKRLLVVAGSPKFDMYAADFGWGEPRKFETIHIDRSGSVCLCTSREFGGGVEIGLSMPS